MKIKKIKSIDKIKFLINILITTNIPFKGKNTVSTMVDLTNTLKIYKVSIAIGKNQKKKE